MENIIINDDCFNIFPKLEKQSIDLICVDLPYGQLNCAWDTEIDLIAMWAHLKRILKQNGQCVFFCNTKFGYKLIESNPKWYRYDMVWEKNTWGGFLRAKKCPLRNFEMIYIFHNSLKTKELNWTYNPQMVKGEPDIRKKGGKVGEMPENYMYGGNIKSVPNRGNPAGLYYPKSILKFSGKKTNGNSSTNKRYHPTEKPVELLEWLIKTYSNENDMVLDFTAGSCSTAVACICIEKEQKYFNIGMERINNNNI